MIKYAEYEFYVEEYRGSLSDDLFFSLINKASRIIDNYVNRKLTEDTINRLTDYEQYQLKYVACELCDFLNENNQVGSISIDGVSISMSETELKQNKNEILSKLPQELTRFL